ncbi:MAG: hypothetical protein R3E02_09920 [Blastomonas sp.]
MTAPIWATAIFVAFMGGVVTGGLLVGIAAFLEVRETGDDWSGEP